MLPRLSSHNEVRVEYLAMRSAPSMVRSNSSMGTVTLSEEPWQVSRVVALIGM